MIDDVLLSLERCSRDPVFLRRFYARFLLESDEAREKLGAVDMRRQESILRGSLYMVLRAAAGHEDGVSHLKKLSISHSRDGYDIGPHLYEHWVDSLVHAVRESDALADDSLIERWRSVLSFAVKNMLAGYDE